MSIAQIDRGKVSQALIDAPIGGPAREEAARLVEGWLEGLESFPEANWRVVAVESPFFIQLAPKILVVGQMDAIFQDEKGFIQGEWKSRKAPRLKRDGLPYQGDTEQDWLEEIVAGPQLSVYALAGREGCFLYSNNHPRLSQQEPRVMVRAAIKSNPVAIWPTKPEEGIFAFPEGVLNATREGILSMASAIRAQRRAGHIPFQLMGYHCKQWNRECEFLSPFCRPHLHPSQEPLSWHPTDPGFEVCKRLSLDIHDPDMVVISQSAIQTYMACAEKYRILYNGHSIEIPSFELETGVGFHAALGAIYGQCDNRATVSETSIS